MKSLYDQISNVSVSVLTILRWRHLIWKALSSGDKNWTDQSQTCQNEEVAATDAKLRKLSMIRISSSLSMDKEQTWTLLDDSQMLAYEEVTTINVYCQMTCWVIQKWPD